MDTTIAEIDKQIKKTKRDTIFIEKIYKPYLESDIAYYVLMHEQGVLLSGEKFIRLQESKEAIKGDQIQNTNDSSDSEKDITPLSELIPQQSRYIFYQQLLEKFPFKSNTHEKD